jgi:hypothetical protein
VFITGESGLSGVFMIRESFRTPGNRLGWKSIMNTNNSRKLKLKKNAKLFLGMPIGTRGSEKNGDKIS